MPRYTKPFALLAAAVASKSAFGALVGATGTPTVTFTPSGPSAANTNQFDGLNDGVRMELPFPIAANASGTSQTVTVQMGWTLRPFGTDFILYTGGRTLSGQVSALFSTKITTLTLLTASGGVNAVFTFASGGQTLNFDNTINMFGDTLSASFNPANPLLGTGDTSGYTLNGGFSFGSSTITGILLTFVNTQTVANGNMGYMGGIEIDAIVGTTPEPSTLGLFGLGSTFAGYWVLKRRRSRSRTSA